LICLSLALILSSKAPAKQTSQVFTTVFVVIWVGSLIVTVNAQLLGATISIFQSICVSENVAVPVCDVPFGCRKSNATYYGVPSPLLRFCQVLGYCVFPLTVSALVIATLRKSWFGTLWLDLIWLALGFLWSTRVSSIFIGQFVKRERRLLALYPVFFFYLLLGWLILLF
jgi:hypothetical protein